MVQKLNAKILILVVIVSSIVTWGCEKIEEVEPKDKTEKVETEDKPEDRTEEVEPEDKTEDKTEEAESVKTITITFENGISENNIEINLGSKIDKPITPEKEGYYFQGWFLDENKKFDFNTILEDDTKVFAKWKVIVIAKDIKHLRALIDQSIAKEGNEVDLNYIDTSEITFMEGLFSFPKIDPITGKTILNRYADFNGDISKWDVSNVTKASHMFSNTNAFNCDISGWNTSSFESVNSMFYFAKGFNQDISQWNVEKVKVYKPFYFGSGLDEDHVPEKLRRK